MPRTQLNFTEPTRAGTPLPAPVAADVVNGQYVNNDARVVVICSNSNVSTTRNVTVTPTATVDGLVPAARTIPIPANSSVIIGPYGVGNYGTQLQISGDNATDVKFQPIHFPG